MKIFLIGFMGSGKTVFGRKLARSMELKFADLDKLIETRYKMSIPGIFEQFDEPIFRNLETKALESYLSNDNFVLSCGGGTPCFNNNLEMINKSGLSIYIKLNEKALAERLLNSKTKRPLMTGVSPDELTQKIKEMLDQREPCYQKANLIINGINIKTDLVKQQVQDFFNN